MAKIDPMKDLSSEPDRKITKQPNPADARYEKDKKKETDSKPPKRGVAPVKSYPPREGTPQTEHPLPSDRKA